MLLSESPSLSTSSPSLYQHHHYHLNLSCHHNHHHHHITIIITITIIVNNYIITPITPLYQWSNITIIYYHHSQLTWSSYGSILSTRFCSLSWLSLITFTYEKIIQMWKYKLQYWLLVYHSPYYSDNTPTHTWSPLPSSFPLPLRTSNTQTLLRNCVKASRVTSSWINEFNLSDVLVFDLPSTTASTDCLPFGIPSGLLTSIFASN